MSRGTAVTKETSCEEECDLLVWLSGFTYIILTYLILAIIKPLLSWPFTTEEADCGVES